MSRILGIAFLVALLLAGAPHAQAGHATAAATAYLQLEGTIPVSGQATVASGETATAYGSGFCGAPACSPVTLRIGDRVAARGVDVGEKGTFRVRFAVLEDPGRYEVTASQTGAGGGSVEDSATLVVVVADVEKEGTPAAKLQVLNAARGVFRASIRPASCCARKAALFQRRVSPGHWRTTKRIMLDRHAARRFTARLPHGISRVRLVVRRTGLGRRSIMSKPLLVRR